MQVTTDIKRYSDLIELPTFEERYDYLKLSGIIGESTFGYNRYFNQRFYTSTEWKKFRRDVIIRDNGCDLGVDDGLHDIGGKIIIHHINPITLEDIKDERIDKLLDFDNVICVSNRTHEAIHFGDESLIRTYVERSPNDTIPWR